MVHFIFRWKLLVRSQKLYQFKLYDVFEREYMQKVHIEQFALFALSHADLVFFPGMIQMHKRTMKNERFAKAKKT